jgi:hypothetical protein
MRRRSWWRELLWAEGEGWLRWAPGERGYYTPSEIEQWVVFPPLRRAWLAIRDVAVHPWLVVRGRVPWNAWPTPLADSRMFKSGERKRLWT